MWLGRLEFNLVSRSSRSSIMGTADATETPREALDALALADLTAHAGMLDEVGKLDRTWTLLAGKREDVSLGDLAALKKRAGIELNDPAAFEKLKAAIGTGWQRTARFHPMPGGVHDLPAIATFLGPRITPESAALQLLAHDAVPDRHIVTPADVAYVLGVDRAKQWIPDRAQYASLDVQLDHARDVIAKTPESGDLYGAWLGALRDGAKKPDGQLPIFMQSEAYDDLRVDSVVTGYAQIRHNYVLIAAQSYEAGGCAIPDGYVEPRVGVYDGIVKYAQRGAAMMTEVDPTDRTGTKDYFANLEKIARVLATISRHELEGRELTDEERAFLGMVVEMTPGETGSSPTYTGWYFDLFRGRWLEALSEAPFIADYFTSAWDGKVAYAGATMPQMGIFVVDTGGLPRLAVGPVARGFGTTGPLAKRFASVEEVKQFDEPWAASYSAPAPKRVPFGLRAERRDDNTIAVYMTAPATVGDFTVDILDHHGAILNTQTRSAIPAKKTLAFRIFQPRNTNPERIRIRVGEYAIEGEFSLVGNTAYIESAGVEAPSDSPPLAY